ncbi:hypothetical protein KAU11_08605 [Candidatus Babeliales bacterium]|nr:hypothetical protein [Candidatus Babeliales bacterium]
MTTDYTKELAACQKEYDLLSVTIENDIKLQGKTLEPALSEQPNMQRNWVLLGAALAWLYAEACNDADTAYGDAFTNAQSDSYKSRNSTEAKWFAERDNGYNDAVRIKNKVFRLKKQVDGILDVIESRKYVLKDLTASIINQQNNTRLI